VRIGDPGIGSVLLTMLYVSAILSFISEEFPRNRQRCVCGRTEKLEHYHDPPELRFLAHLAESHTFASVRK